MSSRVRRYQILVIVLYVVLFGLLLAYSYNFDLSKIINGGDTEAPLNPFILIKKALYIWEESVLGRINLKAFINIIYLLPLALLYGIFPPSLAHFIYWVFLYSLMPTSFFLLAYYLTRNILVSFYGGLLYSLNLYTAIIHHTPTYHMLYLHGITPLLILFFAKYLEQKKTLNKYLFLYSIAYLPLLRTINMYIIYLILIPIYAYVIIRYLKKQHMTCAALLKKTISLMMIIIVLSSPYIFVLGISHTEEATQAKVNLEYSLKAVEASRIHAHLINVLRFILTYGWVKQLPEIPGIQGFSASAIYNENPILIFISFYPILLMTILLIIIIIKANYDLRIFTSLTLLFIIIIIFLAKMVNPPLGQINEFLYAHFPPFLVLFRSACKYMQVPYILLLSIIVVIGLDFLRKKLSRRTFCVVMAIILIIHFVYISPAVLTFSKLVNSAWIVKVPDDYYIIADFFNKQKEPFRILPLPLSKHFTGYVPYTWGYAGPDLLYTLLSKPMIDKYHNPVLPNWSLNMVNRIEQLSYSNLEELINLAKVLNVKYILVRKSVDVSHPYIKVWYPPKVYIDSLNMRSDVVKVLETKNFIVYKLTSYCPRIWIADPSNLRNESIIEPYAHIDNKTTINLRINKEFKKVYSLDLFMDFKLIKKNVTSKDWRIANHQLILSDVMKVSISPRGILYVFLYYNESNIRKFVSIVINIPKESIYDRNRIEIFYVNNSLLIVFNGLILYNKTVSINLSPKVTSIIIGGTQKAEKMIGEIYNITFIVNDDIILSFDDLIEALLDKSLLIKNESSKPLLSTLTCTPKSIGVIRFVKMIDPTLWRAKIKLYRSAILIFSEAYDPHWRLIIYKDGDQVAKIRSIPILNGLNGFIVNETGEILIEIRYEVQGFYFTSIITSTAPLIALCIVLILKSRIRIKLIS